MVSRKLALCSDHRDSDFFLRRPCSVARGTGRTLLILLYFIGLCTSRITPACTKPYAGLATQYRATVSVTAVFSLPARLVFSPLAGPIASRREKNKKRAKNWVDVNERANKLNRMADVGLNKPKGVDADKSPSGEVAYNPYARRNVKPKILWQVGQGDEKKENDENKEPTETKGETNTQAPPPLVQEQHGKKAALNQSHQFAIDEESLVQKSFLDGIGGIGAKKKPKKRVRKGMSLAEYQERKAAGTL